MEHSVQITNAEALQFLREKKALQRRQLRRWAGDALHRASGITSSLQVAFRLNDEVCRYIGGTRGGKVTVSEVQELEGILKGSFAPSAAAVARVGAALEAEDGKESGMVYASMRDWGLSPEERIRLVNLVPKEPDDLPLAISSKKKLKEEEMTALVALMGAVLAQGRG